MVSPCFTAIGWFIDVASHPVPCGLAHQKLPRHIQEGFSARRSYGWKSQLHDLTLGAGAMDGYDTNPFADPVDVNPFQDPSVTQITTGSHGHIEDLSGFNQFSENSHLTTNQKTVPVQPVMPSQPAVLQPSVETSPSPQAVALAAQAGLLQQQEELDRKAAEIERKEKEMRNVNINLRQNNWPPLPPKCPIKPCFYQDFSADIPADYQRICKMLYYLWMLHSFTLLLNVLACLAYFTQDAQNGGTGFGLSILWLVLFTPCAFVCWYRPIYKAFRTDSSFNFFVFFTIFFCQIVIYIIQAVGFPNWGDSGWMVAIVTVLPKNVAVAAIMMIVASFFTVCAVFSIILLKKVHSLYRRTGASFQRAQEEFSQGIVTNRNVQNAAAGAASAAARGAFQDN